MDEIRIVLSEEDFKDLVSGKEVVITKENENSDDLTSVRKHIVKLILSDIGFYKMHEIVEVLNKK